MNFKEQLRLNEDVSLSINSQKTGSDDKAPKNYGEYLSTQVKSMIQKKADFKKANDNEIKNMGKNMATVAKSKFQGIEGLPKNDVEASNMLQSEIAKQSMDADGNGEDTKASIEAEKEIEELTKKISESIEGGIKKVTSAAVVFINLDNLKMIGVHSTQNWSRKSHKDKGPWNLPKGEIDPGEDSLETAVREVKEEIGYDVDPSKLKHLGKFNYLPVKDLEIFVCPIDDKEMDSIVKNFYCDSYFTNDQGQEQPEVDDIAILSLNEFCTSCAKVLEKALGGLLSD